MEKDKKAKNNAELIFTLINNFDSLDDLSDSAVRLLLVFLVEKNAHRWSTKPLELSSRDLCKLHRHTQVTTLKALDELLKAGLIKATRPKNKFEKTKFYLDFSKIKKKEKQEDNGIADSLPELEKMKVALKGMAIIQETEKTYQVISDNEYVKSLITSYNWSKPVEYIKISK